MEQSDYQISVLDSAFARGESDGCGKATTAKSEKDFREMTEYEQKDYLKKLGF